MVSAIKRIVRDIKTEAQNEAENSIKCSGEACSEAKLSAQRLKFEVDRRAPNNKTSVKKSKKFSRNATKQS